METCDKSTDFENLIQECWAEHATNTSQVAEKLSQVSPQEIEDKDIAAYVKILIHTYGSHLNQFNKAIEILNTISEHKARLGQVNHALNVGLAVANTCVGNLEAAHEFSQKAFLRAVTKSAILQIKASAAFEMSTENGATTEARRVFKEALCLAEELKEFDKPLARNLAMAGNGIACWLEQKETLSDDETQFLLQAAAAGRQYWEIAGTWLQVARAEYRLAMSHIKAKQLDKALFHAQECAKINVENNADSYELFFANQALALVYREKCIHLKSMVHEDHQEFCKVP